MYNICLSVVEFTLDRQDIIQTTVKQHHYVPY